MHVFRSHHNHACDDHRSATEMHESRLAVIAIQLQPIICVVTTGCGRYSTVNCMNQFLSVGCATSLKKDWDHGNMDLGKELEQQI